MPYANPIRLTADLGMIYDTTPDSVGANASGTGVLLALAEKLAQPPWSNHTVSVFPFTLEFIAFSQMYAEC